MTNDLDSLRHLRGRWRWPSVRYTNNRTAAAGTPFSAIKWPWFSLRRYWSGRIILVQIKHHEWNFDFRASWIADMLPAVKPN